MVDDITLKRLDIDVEFPLSTMSTPHFILKSVDWGVIQSSHHSFNT